MTCAEFEVLLCDYIDGTLDLQGRAEIQEHMAGCEACRTLAADAASAAAFIARAESVEPPPELLARIAFQIPSEGTRRSWRSSLLGIFEPIFQPRLVMGMAMTILSFSMLGRFVGIDVRQLKPSDLHPAAVWSTIDNRAHRTWERAVKYYENLRLVYEVQTRLQEWTEQEDEERRAHGAESSNTGTRTPSGSQRVTGQGTSAPGVAPEVERQKESK